MPCENICLCVAYSFITGFVFYNFDNIGNDTLSGQPGNMTGLYNFNLEGMEESETNFFALVIKYRHRLDDLNRDAFDSSKEAVVSSFYQTDGVERAALYNYCTGGCAVRKERVFAVATAATTAASTASSIQQPQHQQQ